MLVCVGFFIIIIFYFFNEQKEKWKEHFAAPLSVKVIFLLLLFIGY